MFIRNPTVESGDIDVDGDVISLQYQYALIDQAESRTSLFYTSHRLYHAHSISFLEEARNGDRITSVL